MTVAQLRCTCNTDLHQCWAVWGWQLTCLGILDEKKIKAQMEWLWKIIVRGA